MLIKCTVNSNNSINIVYFIINYIIQNKKII